MSLPKQNRSNRLPRQLSLPLPGQRTGKKAKEYGGEDHERSGKRKTARPFDPGKLLHITMRSSQAVDERSMLHPKRARIIKNIVYKAALRRGVVIKKYVCVGNHLHLLIQTKARRMIHARPALRAFLREVGGLIARVMTGAEKGRPLSALAVGQKFWDHLAWSRVVEWGRDLLGVGRYFLKNEYDAVHVLALNNWQDSDLVFARAGPD